MALVGDDAQKPRRGGRRERRPAAAAGGARARRSSCSRPTGARVRTIDERAATWYAGQDVDDPVNAAELVYHRLRLGDLAGAERRPGATAARRCSLYADEELPVHLDAAREWLRERTHAAPTADDAHAAWEREALERVRALIARGVVQAIGPLLEEREERGRDSPLVLYDAWLRWATATGPGPASSCAATPAGGTSALLDARIAVAVDRPSERRGAARALGACPGMARAAVPRRSTLSTVQAARIHLTVDVAAELRLAGDRQLGEPATGRVAARRRDPSSCGPGAPSSGAESTILTLAEVPAACREPPLFAQTIDSARRRSATGETGVATLDRLLALGKQRWSLVTTTKLPARRLQADAAVRAGRHAERCAPRRRRAVRRALRARPPISWRTSIRSARLRGCRAWGAAAPVPGTGPATS